MTWVTESESGSQQQPAMASEAELGQQEKPVYRKIIEYKKKISLGKESGRHFSTPKGLYIRNILTLTDSLD